MQPFSSQQREQHIFKQNIVNYSSTENRENRSRKDEVHGIYAEENNCGKGLREIK